MTASLPLAYDRATQYSRDASDRAEMPRRTGSPGQAGWRHLRLVRRLLSV